MITGQDSHENYAPKHPRALQWDEVSPRANRLYTALAQAIELEQQEMVIVAVKCPTCGHMVSAYGFIHHTCKGE